MTEDVQNSPPDRRIAVPQLSLPKGGGAISGIGETFQPNPFSGSGSLTIPVYTSPCRGFEPRLSLEYSSGAGNGIFGLGFSISIPNIARKTEKGIPRYDDALDTFLLSNAEDLVLQADKGPKTLVREGESWEVTAYRPRLEGLFAKIEFWKNSAASYWKIVSKENITSIYGRDAMARVSDPRDNARVFKWLLESTFDGQGNKAEYRYKQENTDNVPAALAEKNRISAANKYLQSIRYGNYFNDKGQENWAFELVFDYGEYALEEEELKQPGANPYLPRQEWGGRLDPFSSYRSGFEIRTRRLCRSILMFHHLEKELGETPCLVRATRLKYSQSRELSLLTEAAVQGFRRRPDAGYAIQALPPLKLSYSAFQPHQGEFKTLQVNNEEMAIPGPIGKGRYSFLDLYGEGIPGFLYSNGETTLYWQPAGGGGFVSPAPPASLPLEGNLQKEEYSLVSLAGNGQLDLVVESPQRGGFYSINQDGSWEPYRDFAHYPLDCVNPNKVMVDLQGRGRADLLVFAENDLRFYPSLGKKGFNNPLRINDGVDDEFRWGGGGYREEVVNFAGMFGDGLAHRVRVRQGCVECWPNLGCGRFGAKITLENSPRFEGELDARRLFMADIDGSGTSDLIYAYTDRVEVFFNQGGNSFSEPLTILLPEPLTNLDQLNFADVLGNGTTCLIFSKIGTRVRHYYYDFAGSLKPYILTGTDNSLGLTTKVEYASSVQFYLEDKLRGKPWKTKLPFPVQVVETVRTADDLSGVRLVKRCKYHDGYYDAVEREFRGFGFVEEWDTEDYALWARKEFVQDFAGQSAAQLYVPPVYTKRWYHTGASWRKDNFSRHYREDYFSADPSAYAMPDSTWDEETSGGDGETLRQAYRSLQGRLLREEIYGLDGNDRDNKDREGIIPANPYSVKETNYHIRRLQPRNRGKYAVFYVHDRETITYLYERNPADPRIEHNFTLEVDEWGNVRKSCRVFYPRRRPERREEDGGASYICPEQTKLAATAATAEFINKTGDFWLLGIPWESKSWEIGGLDLQGNLYFSYTQITEEVRAALSRPLNYEDEFKTPGKQARLLAWQRDYYWDEEQEECLPLGGVSARALVHHRAAAVFSPQLLEKVFAGRVSAALLEGEGGYVLEEGIWWNPGLVRSYYREGDRKFFLPCRVESPVAAGKAGLSSQTLVEYDEYALAQVKITRYLAADLTNTVTASVDYNVLKLWQITDANDNVSQVLFDPLGMVVAASAWGTLEGKAQGDGDLKDYQAVAGAGFRDILTSPAEYLQQASSFFYYDLFAYLREGQPAGSIQLSRESCVNDLAPGEETRIQIRLSFTNGFGQEIETKVKVEPGAALGRDAGGRVLSDADGGIVREEAGQRWLVSGRRVYNNKGKAVMQYQPFFSDSFPYEGREEAELLLPPPTVTHYDPLLRPVRVDKPQGIPPGGREVEYFFTKAEFSPWEEKNFDENDTLKDSRFYRDFMKNYPPDPTQEEQDFKDALDKAALFYRTPDRRVLDNRGNPFLEIQDNLGEVTAGTLQEMVAGTGVSSQDLFNQLAAKGYILKEVPELQAGWVSRKFQPYNQGFVLDLDEGYQQFAGSLIRLLKESCLTTCREYDSQGQVLRSADPRLYYTGIKEKTAICNLQYVYNMAGKPLAVLSADAGSKLMLENIYGNTIRTWEGRDFHIQTSYDALQRPLEVCVSGEDGGGPVLNQTVERIVYGEYFSPDEGESKARNLRGQIYRHFDQAGLETFGLYNLQGLPLENSRRLLADYKREPNWDDPRLKLEEEEFLTSFRYDGLGRIRTQTTADHSVYIPAYNAAGLLQKVEVQFAGNSRGGRAAGVQPGAPDNQPVVADIQYNAGGQRLSISYGNGVVTNYTYDPVNLRLTGILSRRSDRDPKGNPRGRVLQDIGYVYDPVGNITRVRDSSYKTVFGGGQVVEPLSQYTYDALYRLKTASGRQHPGIFPDPFCSSPSLNDAEKLENYRENYTYDPAGNLIQIQHSAASAPWTRQTVIGADSNRTVQIGTGNGQSRICPTAYDRAGNMLNLENLPGIAWNYRNNVARADLVLREGEPSDRDYYVYDSRGQRVRRITERKIKGGLREIEEKIYLGALELKRIKRLAAGLPSTILERQTLRLRDDSQGILVSYFWLRDDLQRETDRLGLRQNRFQLNNQLGSSCLEADDSAGLISYEEYFPYGGTAMLAGSGAKEVSLKEYRFSGRERDGSTGLYYYGARYYIPWLGRWLNPDPAGSADGLNMYAFVQGNPVSFVDRDGRMGVRFVNDDGDSHPIGAMIPEALAFNHELVNNALARLERPDEGVRNIVSGWLGGRLGDEDYAGALGTLRGKVGTLAQLYNRGRDDGEGCGCFSFFRRLFADPEETELFTISREEGGNNALMSVRPFPGIINLHPQTWQPILENIEGDPRGNPELQLFVSLNIIHEQFHKYSRAVDNAYVGSQEAAARGSRVTYRQAEGAARDMNSPADYLENADTLAGIVTQLGTGAERYERYRVQLNRNFSKSFGQVVSEALAGAGRAVRSGFSGVANAVAGWFGGRTDVREPLLGHH